MNEHINTKPRNVDYFKIVRTPFQAPNANAYAESWVRTVREECLDHLLILNEAHLRRVLNTYIAYYNASRPHQGLGQQIPIPRKRLEGTGAVQRRKVSGGIINDYYRVAGSTIRGRDAVRPSIQGGRHVYG